MRQTDIYRGRIYEGNLFYLFRLAKMHKQRKQPKELIVRFANSGEIIGHRSMGEGEAYPSQQPPYRIQLLALSQWEFLASSGYYSGKPIYLFPGM
jgi:hypothetical protein